MSEDLKEQFPPIQELKMKEFFKQREYDIAEELRNFSSREVSPIDYEMLRLFMLELEVYYEAVNEIKNTGVKNKHDQVSAAVTVKDNALKNLYKLYSEINKLIEFEPNPKKFNRKGNHREDRYVPEFLKNGQGQGETN